MDELFVLNILNSELIIIITIWFIMTSTPSSLLKFGTIDNKVSFSSEASLYIYYINTLHSEIYEIYNYIIYYAKNFNEYHLKYCLSKLVVIRNHIKISKELLATIGEMKITHSDNLHAKAYDKLQEQYNNTFQYYSDLEKKWKKLNTLIGNFN